MPAQTAAIAGPNNYASLLNEAWADHLAPRRKNAPSVISTFAGCGGSSLGYSMAGFRELLAVEWEQNAVDTFRLNFPHVPVHQGDIASLMVDEVLRMMDLKQGELDVFDGSPPCQGFSTAGKREMGDSRNQLFQQYVRLLRGLSPKVFVMENVSGMVKGKMKLIFTDILRELKASGYKVSARLMNAAYFNVPQNRERMIFIGVRNDLGVDPSHPRAETQPRAVRDAIGGVRVTECPPFNDFYANLWSRVPLGGNASAVVGKGYNSCIKVNPRKPSPTLPKLQTGRGFATIAHWSEPRALSIAEAKRLGSFPDAFALIGSYTEQWARIGNSVPPLFMRAIATHVRKHILDLV